MGKEDRLSLGKNRASVCRSGDSICSSSFDRSFQIASITLGFSSLDRLENSRLLRTASVMLFWH